MKRFGLVFASVSSAWSPLAQGAPPEQPPAAVRGFQPAGLLLQRTLLNFDRMDSARFAAVEESGCLREPSYVWPGDMEGRALLAFVRLERATGRPSVNLPTLRSAWAGRLNKQGYFGKELDPQAIDEQQLSGHGWVLRALCELYDWKHEPAVLDEISTIVKNLALPTRGAHETYPIESAARAKGKGGVIGEQASKAGRWVLSTDIGCDLIFMDGLMQAATLLHDPELDALCEEILARSLQIDFAKIQAQTHSTLTGLRAMLRWAEFKKRPSLVAEAEKRFQLYLNEAMSENNENWNWFGRPTHTEPCAVVDSFMVAHELWRLTGKAEYLAWAHRIVYNGFFAEQGSNGGFGCSSVSGGKGSRTLGILAPEAWWCCSMRAAEGFAELAGNEIYSDSDGVYVVGLNPGKIDMPLAGGRLAGLVTGGYPHEGKWTFEVQSAPDKPVAFRFFTPPWAAHPTVALNGKPVDSRLANGFTIITQPLKANDILTFAFDQAIYTRSQSNRSSLPNLMTYNYGPMVLALPSGAPESHRLPKADAWRWDAARQCAVANGFDGVLSPLGERFQTSPADLKTYSRQLLFDAHAE